MRFIPALLCHPLDLYINMLICYLKVYVAAGVLFGKHLLVRLRLYGEIVYGMAELLAAKA